MKEPFETIRGFHRGILVSLLALSFLTGCGPLQRWYNGRKGPKNPHSVTINWNASASPVQGYYVYRASPPGTAAKKINVRAVEGTQFTDDTVEAGQSYSYYVTAVDPKGTESSPSANIAVTVPLTVTSPAAQ
jgi:hypothetical protein